MQKAGSMPAFLRPATRHVQKDHNPIGRLAEKTLRIVCHCMTAGTRQIAEMARPPKKSPASVNDSGR